jgi:hypothetical protein
MILTLYFLALASLCFLYEKVENNGQVVLMAAEDLMI